MASLQLCSAHTCIRASLSHELAFAHVSPNVQHQNGDAIVDSQGVSEKEFGDHIGGIDVSSAVKGPVRGTGRGSSPWPGMSSCCCRTEGDILAPLTPGFTLDSAMAICPHGRCCRRDSVPLPPTLVVITNLGSGARQGHTSILGTRIYQRVTGGATDAPAVSQGSEGRIEM